MENDPQLDLLSPVTDIDVFRLLIADLHNDLTGKLARYRQLFDLSASLSSNGVILAGGEISLAHWTETRSSFINGNYAATVLLAQGLAEHILASYLVLELSGDELPDRIAFTETLRRCRERDVISRTDEADFRSLMNLRNPLSHFRPVTDPSSLTRRAIESAIPANEHLRRDATFAISMAVRLLSLPVFHIGD